MPDSGASGSLVLNNFIKICIILKCAYIFINDDLKIL